MIAHYLFDIYKNSIKTRWYLIAIENISNSFIFFFGVLAIQEEFQICFLQKLWEHFPPLLFPSFSRYDHPSQNLILFDWIPVVRKETSNLFAAWRAFITFKFIKRISIDFRLRIVWQSVKLPIAFLWVSNPRSRCF